MWSGGTVLNELAGRQFPLVNEPTAPMVKCFTVLCKCRLVFGDGLKLCVSSFLYKMVKQTMYAQKSVSLSVMVCENLNWNGRTVKDYMGATMWT